MRPIHLLLLFLSCLTADRALTARIETPPTASPAARHRPRRRAIRWTRPGTDMCRVAYAPTHFDPGLPLYPDTESLRLDLTTLHAAGFEGLATYASNGALNQIPGLAREVGFDGLIVMGIYDPRDPVEIDRALAESTHVDAYCVGNEGLSRPHEGYDYTLEDLEQAFETIRTATGRPVTTSEPDSAYLEGPGRTWFVEHCDFLFPNVHPYWAGVADPGDAVDWTTARYRDLAAAAIVPSTGDTLEVILKEVGLPTAGAPGVSEGNQALFFDRLWDTEVRFFYFEGFDQYWKQEESVEPYWGLFDRERVPKEVVGFVCGNTPPVGIGDPAAGESDVGAFALGQNRPNPFNPSTTIAFDLPMRAHVRLGVFDLRGRRVRQLLSEVRERGRHEVWWDGRDERGMRVTASVYLLDLTADGRRLRRKMVLRK